MSAAVRPISDGLFRKSLFEAQEHAGAHTANCAPAFGDMLSGFWRDVPREKMPLPHPSAHQH